MIIMIKPSTSSKKTISYGAGASERKDQRVSIVDSQGVLIPFKDIDFVNDAAEYRRNRAEVKRIASQISEVVSGQFNSQARRNDKVKNNTGHMMVSFEPREEYRVMELSGKWKCSLNDAYTRIIKDVISEMGIGNTQHLIIRHHDKQNPHFHIPYNRVQLDGTVVNSSFYKARAGKVGADLARKYGLTVAQKGMRNGNGMYDKLRADVMAAYKSAHSFASFEDRLVEKNISYKLYCKDDCLEPTGIAFKYSGFQYVGGYRLSPELSIVSINARFEEMRRMEEKAQREAEAAARARKAEMERESMQRCDRQSRGLGLRLTPEYVRKHQK